MDIKGLVKNLCTKLGKNNKPIYAVMAIACAKGIARPTITMMDKHEDPTTKKYTALREFLTEVVAIPTYWACGEMAGKLGSKLNIAPEKKAMASHSLMFLGVCTAALIIIPALASITIKPFMNAIQGKNQKKKDSIASIETTTQPNFKANKISAIKSPYAYNTQSYGMKVGGL